MRILSYEECAGRTNLARRSFERLISRGDGPPVVHISLRRRGILEADLENWILARRRAAPGEQTTPRGSLDRAIAAKEADATTPGTLLAAAEVSPEEVRTTPCAP